MCSDAFSQNVTKLIERYDISLRADVVTFERSIASLHPYGAILTTQPPCFYFRFQRMLENGNWENRNLESEIRNPESGTGNPESRDWTSRSLPKLR